MPRLTRRVVVTGFGGLTNLGHTAPATWEGMREGRSGIGPIDHSAFRDEGQAEGAISDQWAVKFAGQVRGWTPRAVEKREHKRFDRAALLGLDAALEAVEHSGWDHNAGDPARHGVIIGSGIGGIRTIEESYHTLLHRGPSRISPFTVPRLMVNATTGNISIRFNLQGPATAHSTACASSGHAIGDAANAIRLGLADVMVAGGAEAAVTPLCVGAFTTMKALSTRNDDPQAASRPFDTGRDGFVLSEGAAMFILESEEHAKARGATIYAEVVGFANSADAHHIAAPEPEGRGAFNAMKWALRDAELDANDIDHINAHGTSTPLGDRAELLAVKKIFGDHAKAGGGGLSVTSTKSMHGHALGASGAVEMIACIHAVREGVLAPTINLDEPDADFDVDIVANEARQTPVKTVMNNTFGFGGHNVSLIVARYES
ncbi:MAG: beta-ketoacyl-ACP synthase II [Planctomycetota bacterium]